MSYDSLSVGGKRSLSSCGSPSSSSGVSNGRMSLLNVFDHLGTQTSVSVGVFDKDVRP